jgi:ankyrin repeat protein
MGSLRSLRRNHAEPVEIPKPSDEELIKTVRFGTITQLKTLLERGADPNAMDKDSTPALHFAVYFGKLGMTRILVKYGADVNLKDRNQDAALDNAIYSRRWYRAERVALFLLDNGADVNSVGKDGRTTLMHAVLHKRFDLARLLVERGADPNRRNRDWKRAVNLIGHGRGSKALRKMLKKIS